MNILVINAGSSTLKFSLFHGEIPNRIAGGTLEWKAEHGESRVKFWAGKDFQKEMEVSTADYAGAVQQAFLLFQESGALPQGESVKAVGYRVVHGGEKFRASVLLKPEVKKALEQLSELAPLHNPPALEAMAAVEKALPGIPSVAVFDTSFHATIPAEAHIYPLPIYWYRQWGIRRYGFHGISHDYCSRRAVELLRRGPENLRLVICHLGNGCSATAVRDGKSIDTTMGFTPLEGLMMGTRCGSIDPSIPLFVQQRKNISPEELDKILNHQSGLLGISGVGSDYREVEQAAERGDERAKLSLDMFAYHVRKAIGSLATVVGGMDALVFTAGIGENAMKLRKNVCQGLEFLGVHLDEGANMERRPDCDIATNNSRVRVLVIHTQEDLLIARETKSVLGL